MCAGYAIIAIAGRIVTNVTQSSKSGPRLRTVRKAEYSREYHILDLLDAPLSRVVEAK
jgi:hypothetical protein